MYSRDVEIEIEIKLVECVDCGRNGRCTRVNMGSFTYAYCKCSKGYFQLWSRKSI